MIVIKGLKCATIVFIKFTLDGDINIIKQYEATDRRLFFSYYLHWDDTIEVLSQRCHNQIQYDKKCTKQEHHAHM